MQSIAREFGYSETVFLSKSDKSEFKVKFFTPLSEVDMCGHATIAFTQTLIDNKLIGLKNGWNTLNVEINLGIMPIYIFKDGNFTDIFMQQDAPKLEKIVVDPEDVLKTMGLSLNSLNKKFPIIKGYTGLWDLFIPLNSVEDLENIVMNKESMLKMSKKYNFISFHPFVLLDKNRARVRNFAPICGIDEESATGTSNGALSYLLYSEKVLNIDTLLCVSQGKEMKRESEIKVKILSDNNDKIKVLVGGTAKKFLEGTI